MGDKGIHTFPRGIYRKVNAVEYLEFEFVYYAVKVQHISCYTTEPPFYRFYS